MCLILKIHPPPFLTFECISGKLEQYHRRPPSPPSSPAWFRRSTGISDQYLQHDVCTSCNPHFQSPMRESSLFTVYFTSLNSPHETSAYETSWRVSHGSRKLHWSGLCSEILADGCVCGSFEVVADVLKYPSEDRRFGEQVLFDSFLMVLRRRRRVLLCRWALFYTRSYQKGTHEGRIITLLNL